MFTCICDSSEGLGDRVHLVVCWSGPPQRLIRLFIMIY